MEIGKLNKRVKIYTYEANTSDGYGGFTQGAKTETTVWAKVRQLSQSEMLLNGLKIGEINNEFTLRYSSILTQRNEIEYDNKVFRIIEVLNIDEANKVIKVIASERIN